MYSPFVNSNTSIEVILYTSYAIWARCIPSFYYCLRIWTLLSSGRTDLKVLNRWTDNSVTASRSAEQLSKPGSNFLQTITLAIEISPGTTTISPNCLRMALSSTS
ncbi:hypothetical protein VTI28DRAFT_5045 [Corynascus sepedonium]